MTKRPRIGVHDSNVHAMELSTRSQTRLMDRLRTALVIREHRRHKQRVLRRCSLALRATAAHWRMGGSSDERRGNPYLSKARVSVAPDTGTLARHYIELTNGHEHCGQLDIKNGEDRPVLEFDVQTRSDMRRGKPYSRMTANCVLGYDRGPRGTDWPCADDLDRWADELDAIATAVGDRRSAALHEDVAASLEATCGPARIEAGMHGLEYVTATAATPDGAPSSAIHYAPPPATIDLTQPAEGRPTVRLTTAGRLTACTSSRTFLMWLPAVTDPLETLRILAEREEEGAEGGSA
jgi:hypothetical protein